MVIDPRQRNGTQARRWSISSAVREGTGWSVVKRNRVIGWLAGRQILVESGQIERRIDNRECNTYS
ncbi:hypothetical protein WG66_001933, partial [Moniliophthora roreri]